MVLQRAYEKRRFRRSLLPEGELPAPGDDLSDCRHGCNGDCLQHSGPSECGYACHPGELREGV